jgi:MFS transporter, YNFM family, putative membrane transport protein
LTFIETGTTEYKKASIALFLGGFVTFSILYTTQPLMPVFAKEFNVTAAQSSLALSLSTGILAIVMLFAASLSDSFGKKKIMMVSLILTSFLGILTALSPNFITLLSFRAALGVSSAGLPSIAMAYVGEEFNPKAIGRIMGLYISGNSFGGLSGRMITGVMTDLFSWRIAIGTVGLLALLLSVLFWYMLPKPRHSQTRAFQKISFRPYKNVLMNKKLVALIFLAFLMMGGFVTLYNYIGFMLMEPPFNLSQTMIGFIFLVYLFGTFSSMYMGKKADMYGNFPMIMLSISITVGGALLTLLPSLILKIIGVSVFTFGFFASHSIASAWVGETSGQFKAQASSLYLLNYYMGSSLVGTFGGFFWTNFHWGGVITMVTFLFVMAFPLVLFAHKKEQLVSQYRMDS